MTIKRKNKDSLKYAKPGDLFYYRGYGSSSGERYYFAGLVIEEILTDEQVEAQRLRLGNAAYDLRNSPEMGKILAMATKKDIANREHWEHHTTEVGNYPSNEMCAVIAQLPIPLNEKMAEAFTQGLERRLQHQGA